MRWPSDSATEHLRRCIPCNGLQSVWYSNQFGVNPEVVCAIVAAFAQRGDVDFITPENLLDVPANECACGMAIGSTTTGSLFTRMFSQYSNHDDSPVEGLDHLEVPLAFLTYVIEQLWFISCNLNSTAELYTLEWFRCSGTSPHPDYKQQECQILKSEQKPHKLQLFYRK